MNFLKRLFGASPPKSVAPAPTSVVAVAPSHEKKETSSRGYFDTMARMQGAVSRRDFDEAAALVRKNLGEIAAWVKQTRREFGSFVIGSIPSLEQGGKVLALVGDRDGLAEMARIVAAHADLEPWAEQVEQHRSDADLFVLIQKVVEATPGILQTDMKAQVGETDGSRVAVLIGYLERAGRLVRVKSGRTYKLLPPGSSEIPPPAPRRVAASHRKDRQPPKLREIDISKLSYVPLPRSPLQWEEAQAGRERAKVSPPTSTFEVRDAPWRITTVEKIPPDERPDTAFRQTFTSGDGVILIDGSGKAEGLGQVPAAALCYDRDGRQTVKAGLSYDVYRVGVHPLGRGLIAMSRDCALHAYDDKLDPTFETALAEAPEIIAILKRFGVEGGELKNHIRCVALARDSSRYLFTAVDEAWCIGADGVGLWGAKLPLKEGWTRVASPSSNFGTSADVESALTLMSLTLPVTPEEVKARYRTLAKQWHPDLNSGDPHAGEKMKSLTAAAEVLTGVEASALPRYTGASFIREVDRREFEAGGMKFSMTIGIQVSERFASDWIYAASFSAASNGAYLAGYSGRVVLVDEKGVGVRVYDIGAVPRRIIDTGRYLYMLTDTRLYVLQGDALHAIIDTFDGGDLIVAQDGFGLLEKARLRWYSAAGKYLGSIVTKDPIRRVYYSNDHMILETRQHRALIEGVPGWWT